LRLPVLPLILLLPFAEIAGFVIVGRQIGVLPTLGLVVLSSIVGFMLLRIQGLGILDRIRREMERGNVPGREMTHGVMVVLAGFLLMLPGFITDILGLLLFIPWVRDRVWLLLGRRIVVSGGSFRTRRGPDGHGGTGGKEKTIDLDADDYSRSGKADTPWRLPRD
jgi:UPF0716 protein FxsA